MHSTMYFHFTIHSIPIYIRLHALKRKAVLTTEGHERFRGSLITGLDVLPRMLDEIHSHARCGSEKPLTVDAKTITRGNLAVARIGAEDEELHSE